MKMSQCLILRSKFTPVTALLLGTLLFGATVKAQSQAGRTATPPNKQATAAGSSSGSSSAPVSTADSTSSKLFIESQLRYESELRNQISDTLARLLGPQKFFSVAVNVKLKKISPLAQLDSNTASLNDLDVTGLVFTPLPNQIASGSQESAETAADYRIQNVDVDLTVDSKLSPEQQRSVLNLVKNSLSGLPARVNLRAIESLAEDPASIQARAMEEANRKIASEAAAREAQKSVLERYQLLILISGLLLATLIMGLLTKQGLGLLASGISSLGESLNTRNVSKVELDGELAGKDLPKDFDSGKDGTRDGTSDDLPEGVNKPLLSISMRYFERNRTIFLQYLEEKPHLIYSQISKEPDANIALLRVLGPYMNTRNREQLKKLLGTRATIISDESASYDTIRALDWLNRSVEKICTSEIGEDVTLTSSLESEDIFALSTMKEKDFEELAEELPANDKNAWNVLAQMLPKQSIRALYEKVPLEQWANLFHTVQTSSSEEKAIAKKLINRARQKAASRRLSNEAQEKLFSKLIPELVAHLSSQVIHEELQKWAAVYSRIPGLRERIEANYWTLEKLALIPDAIIVDWSKGFTTSVLSALLYYVELSGQDQLLGRVLKALPEGTRKTVVIAGYTKLKSKEPSRQQMLSDAAIIRRALDGLRAAFLKGQFKLSDSPDDARRAA